MPTGLALNATTGQITGTPSAAGTYNVTIFVTDSLVTVSRSFVWTITSPAADTTAPALTITSHTNGQTLSAASVTISGTATDSGRGGNGVSSVTVNGQAATGGTASWQHHGVVEPDAHAHAGRQHDRRAGDRHQRKHRDAVAHAELLDRGCRRASTVTAECRQPAEHRHASDVHRLRFGRSCAASNSSSSCSSPVAPRRWCSDWSTATTYTWTPATAGSLHGEPVGT